MSMQSGERALTRPDNLVIDAPIGYDTQASAGSVPSVNPMEEKTNADSFEVTAYECCPPRPILGDNRSKTE